MADLGVVYDDGRRRLSDYVRGLPDHDVNRSVPATPGWTVGDIIRHLAGDVESILAGDFPSDFFNSFGDTAAVVKLNDWTKRHVEARRSHTLDEVLSEWEENSHALVQMMNRERSWPEGMPPFTATVAVTDLGVHQQDIYGAFGEERDRDGAPVRIGTAGYIAAMGLRLGSAGVGSLRVVAGDKERIAGDGEPAATVRAKRFEMFRALSGRRSPEQIRSFEWHGEPDPYIPYFFPYGIREEALTE